MTFRFDDDLLKPSRKARRQKRTWKQKPKKQKLRSCERLVVAVDL